MTTHDPGVESRRGLLFGAAAYGLWGLLPVYWRAMDEAGSVELLAHRFLWSFVIVAFLLWIRPRPGWWRTLRQEPGRLRYLALAALFIAVNWAVFIWAVNHEHVVETSLGYFTNPLVTVLVGVVVFRERLRPGQWTALGIAAVAVLWLSVDYGRLPWVSLALALTFAAYGTCKKKADTAAVPSLAVETTLILPFALGYLLWLELAGRATFGHLGVDFTVMLAGAGLVTAVPLLFFSGAATRIPMTALGLLQYLAPTLTFLLGVFAFGEPMPATRLVGFGIVWLALVVFTTEGVLHRRRRTAKVPAAPPV